MSILTSIKDAYQGWSGALPQASRKAAVRSFVGSAVFSTVLSGSLRSGFKMGALAATAALVDAALKPCFDHFSNHRNEEDFSLGEEWCRKSLSVIAAGALGRSAGYRITREFLFFHALIRCAAEYCSPTERPHASSYLFL